MSRIELLLQTLLCLRCRTLLFEIVPSQLPRFYTTRQLRRHDIFIGRATAAKEMFHNSISFVFNNPLWSPDHRVGVYGIASKDQDTP